MDPPPPKTPHSTFWMWSQSNTSFIGDFGTSFAINPMPWQTYSQLTDDDLRAMFAYLRTVPPIKNRVPEAQPAAPPPVAGAEAGA